MLKSTASIMESLASIKANTANHKEGLDEIKNDFEKHVEKDHNDIKRIERRIFDSEKLNEGRRRVDQEEREKYFRDRAKKDQKVAEDIASLQSTRKYNYLTASGIYIILAAVLKKLFS